MREERHLLLGGYGHARVLLAARGHDEGQVEVLARALPLALVLRRAHLGVREELAIVRAVDADLEHAAVGLEVLLCAVFVVHVPVDDGHLAHLLRLVQFDLVDQLDGVVQEAEAVDVVFAACVVPRRSDDQESVFGFFMVHEPLVDRLAEYLVGCLLDQERGGQYCVLCLLVDVDVFETVFVEVDVVFGMFLFGFFDNGGLAGTHGVDLVVVVELVGVFFEAHDVTVGGQDVLKLMMVLLLRSLLQTK